MKSIELKGRLFFSLLLFCAALNAQVEPINWAKSNAWVDTAYARMTDDERIAQLMMIAAFPQRDSAHFRDLECHVKELRPGGLIFFKTTSPVKQAALINYYQAMSKLPMLIGIDGEWGLSMRIDSTPVYPRQMVLGAARDESLAYKMGRQIGAQCRRIGIQFNFAPDVDVNNNPNNPVINDRSFGENKFDVAKLGSAYAHGLQDEGVLACAKHFPGHGDVETDSHYSLPLVRGNRSRLDSLELYPFAELAKKGVMSIMSAHLSVPVLDSTPNIASSLSRPIITGLLREQMHFDGLIVTDALNMKGVTDYFGTGEAAARAFAAGNDMLLFVEDMPVSIMWIKEYIARGQITWEQIEQSCKRILKAKYWAGLHDYKPSRLEGLTDDLNCCGSEVLIRRILRKGIIVARNDEKMIPLQNPELYRIACVTVGTGQFTAFQEMCSRYMRADYYSIDKIETQDMFDSLYSRLHNYNLLVISLQNTSRYVARRLGLTPLEIDFLNKLTAIRKNIFVCNGNPYILGSFPHLKNAIVSFEDLEQNNRLAAQVMFGACKASGVMPVTVNNEFPMGSGALTEELHRLEFLLPEEKIHDPGALLSIDSLVNDAIAQGAMPGCQVMMIKDGKVLYDKAFGSHNYDGATAVKGHHLYDLASLTKILGTTLALMHLYDQKKISLEDQLGKHLPWVRGTNKEHLTIHDVMLHQAGLMPFIPFYQSTLVNGKPNQAIYQQEQDSNFSIPVARGLYMNKLYEPMIWRDLLNSPVKTKPDYVYSDLGFMLLAKVVEQLAGMPIEEYLKKNIYGPLNLPSLCFNPLNQFTSAWIVPTEVDTVFRMQQLHGTVHDPGAAMLGGVAGHAGLFGSAGDVGIIMQMLLNGGTYGGKRVLNESTVHQFTKKHSKINRRGLGFDKPETDPKKQSPASRYASPQAFGHTGFTGTCTWADPRSNMVYVFLSNRVNPTASNKKLVEMNVRTRIMDIMYEALKGTR